MTRKIYVTSAQVEAARMIVERSAERGQSVSEAIRMIAEAMPEPHRGDTEPVADRTRRRIPPAKTRSRRLVVS
jgi:Flp pilus assembly protein TadB